MTLPLCGVVFLLLAVATANGQQELSFGVLGLFHPTELVLQQDGNDPVIALGEARLVLNREPGHGRLVLRARGDRIAAEGQSARSWTANARDGGAVAFRLTVPGKLQRNYRGRLTVTARNGELTAVVSMDREVAVASIVAAELNSQAPMEALKAQAVATRSLLAAGRRHQDFDFCDTTHCQFLRSPPAADSNAWIAVRATRGMVLEYRSKPVAAMYSSRCGGRTHSLEELGAGSSEGYPYYAVACEYCQRHPVKWRSEVEGREPEAGDEFKRIAQARLWGWSVVPGSDFKVTRGGTGWILEGHSIGHGLGMCQYGAVGMAASGAGFRQILQHYYPNTQLAELR